MFYYVDMKILAALILGASLQAATLNLSFSSDWLSTVAGTVDFTVTIPGIANGGSGTAAASSVLITSAPFSVYSGLETTAWAQQFQNSWTLTNGQLTSATFEAADYVSDVAAAQAGHPLDIFVVNTTAATYGPLMSGGVQDPAYTVQLFEQGSWVNDEESLAGISFPNPPQEHPASTTPEPAGFWLMEAGIVIVFVYAWRWIKRV